MLMDDIYTQVWDRTGLKNPGYCLLDEGVVDSWKLRRRMVEVKQELSARTPFVFRSATRFNQQRTTKFHLDGGPPQNILMLGYEPSQVKSRLFLADHARAARDLSRDISELVSATMFGNDALVQPYAVELPAFDERHSYILLINNSLETGVLHKAEMVTPDDSKQRVVNSAMLATEGEEINDERLQDFLTTVATRGAY